LPVSLDWPLWLPLWYSLERLFPTPSLLCVLFVFICLRSEVIVRCVGNNWIVVRHLFKLSFHNTGTYALVIDLNLSWPAVSQIWAFITLSSISILLKITRAQI
jgi:hypothetical protein